MKKEYVKPMIEIIDFQAKDMIMADDENEKVYNPGMGNNADKGNSNIRNNYS